jgi:hypothetical protein
MSDNVLTCTRGDTPSPSSARRTSARRISTNGAGVEGSFLGGLGELFTSREKIAMYACESGGHVEFFLPE